MVGRLGSDLLPRARVARAKVALLVARQAVGGKRGEGAAENVPRLKAYGPLER